MANGTSGPKIQVLAAARPRDNPPLEGITLNVLVIV